MPSNFTDLEKVWKLEIKSGKKVKRGLFFQSYNKCFISFGQILFNLSRMFAAHHEKSFVAAFFKVSIDHLFDNLESEKEIIVLEKKA